MRTTLVLRPKDFGINEGGLALLVFIILAIIILRYIIKWFGVTVFLIIIGILLFWAFIESAKDLFREG